MDLTDTGNGVCIKGFKASGVKEGKTGIALIYSDVLCECAAVFTKNSVKAAHIFVTKKNMKNGLKAVVINSGNANACVKEGVPDAVRMCEETGKNLGVLGKIVGVASTGVIGKRLNLEEITTVMKKASKNLGGSKKKSLDAAKAIMTTDTKPKMCSAEYKGIEVGGIAKGAGMIAPNMGTMLSFLTTNANIGKEKLKEALTDSVEKSFNMVVVDGDTSTNDTVLLMSNRKKDCSVKDFKKVLDYVASNLAQKIASDGEGATKFIELSVVNAKDNKNAGKAVKAILSSPLVKTALYGENPNWGRILSKIGSTVKVDYKKVRLSFSDDAKKAYALDRGRVCDRSKVGEIIKSKRIKIVVDLNSGHGKATGWGCDLSLEYVRINAEYN